MGNRTSARGRRVATHACPRQHHFTNATTEAEVAPNYTPPRRYEGECPLCGEAGKLVVEPRQERGYAPWRVWCRKASCCDLSPGEWLREVAKTVGAPGGWAFARQRARISEWLSGLGDTHRPRAGSVALVCVNPRSSLPTMDGARRDRLPATRARANRGHHHAERTRLGERSARVHLSGLRRAGGARQRSAPPISGR